MRTLRLISGNTTLRAELLDTSTAEAIWQALPLNARAHTWGDEVYFDVPIEAELESDAKEVIEAGELAFWPDGKVIAIGFGPTPISQGDEIRLAARTNVWAHALDDVRCLQDVHAGDAIRIETD